MKYSQPLSALLCWPLLIQSQAHARCEVGTVTCKTSVTTGPEITDRTCEELAVAEFAGYKLFLELNPQLSGDCANLQPNTEYCTMGCVCEPPPPRPAVGDVVCRYETSPGTQSSAGDACESIPRKYQIAKEKFLKLNPVLNADCSNFDHDTSYCVAGWIEPLRAWDGLCGPKHNNATCRGTDLPCCNSETWQCGNTFNDCRRGTCYEGICWGHDVYTVTGKCGSQHGGRECAGKWGDCCNMDGECGGGPDFCGLGQCQSGDCESNKWLGADKFWDPAVALPSLGGTTTDGSCGGAKGYTCNSLFGECCSRDGVCGSDREHCTDGCQSEFGRCFVSPICPVPGNDQNTNDSEL